MLPPIESQVKAARELRISGALGRRFVICFERNDDSYCTMLGKLFVVAACLMPLTSAIFFSGPEWSGLSVTFSLNPFGSNPDDLPRTVNAAQSEGWTQIAGCDNNGKFRGKRYIKDNDYAVILLFDAQGYIAGIQCGILASDSYPPMKQRGNIFQEDRGRFMLTAYFTDPANICTSGRSAAQFEEEGTGSTLYIQNGSDPVTQSVSIPSAEGDVVPTSWTKGKCFRYRMGMHYWYNVSKDMNCEDFQPVFLLYNGRKLNAFGWAMGIHQTSSRYEHPDNDQISMFMKPVPRCLLDYPNLSTMHIYLTAYPSTNLC